MNDAMQLFDDHAQHTIGDDDYEGKGTWRLSRAPVYVFTHAQFVSGNHYCCSSTTLSPYDRAEQHHLILEATRDTRRID